MVRPVTNDIGAQHTARMIKMFRDRLRLVNAERACLDSMVEELTDVLLQYRQGVRRARDLEEDLAEGGKQADA